MRRPRLPSRQSWASMWKRASVWLAIIGVAIIVSEQFLLPVLLWDTHQQNNTIESLTRKGIVSQDNHHAQNAKQQAEILALLHEVEQSQAEHSATLQEVAALQQQVANVIDGLPAADQYLGKLAVGLENQVLALCNAVHASCASLPVSVGPSPSSSSAPASAAPAPKAAATSTTTTSQPGHRGKRTRS